MRVALRSRMIPSETSIERGTSCGRSDAWALVLAGGKGMRLRGLTRHVYGEDRPKQYAVLTGGKSLLRQTLDRVRLRVPPERTVVVTMAGQGAYLTAELRNESPAPHVLEQPKDRGTAAAILLGAHWILARDPRAVMIVMPSDHFVADDVVFMDKVNEVVEAVERRRERIVLLGAEPSEPEADYGWIELGEPLPGPEATQLHHVVGFIEEPDPATANRLFQARSALWNTFVFGASALALVDTGRECLPLLHERLVRLDRFLGTEHERWAVAQAYEFAPRASFSRELLERCPTKLAAMRLSAVSWRDLGTSRRVIRTLGELGIRPGWLATLQEAG
jgi:mannose-1-phosphate guanylyltransferase